MADLLFLILSAVGVLLALLIVLCSACLSRLSFFVRSWQRLWGFLIFIRNGIANLQNNGNIKEDTPKFSRLSLPRSSMRPVYDVIVIGSGYGGGIAASRMARAGKSVAILELGSERWPGEYPRSSKEVLRDLHVSGRSRNRFGWMKLFGSRIRTGMYHLIEGDGQNVLVGNGLGGTSLINANVFLRADQRTLQLSQWPIDIRNNPECLDKYYARAEQMLQPTPYPSNYPPLRKLRLLQKQAYALGQEENFYRVPQTTFFRNGFNNAGVEMKASTGSGQDCTGINDGSKNSVLMNYIPDAWNHGAEIFCQCEVRYVRKHPSENGYLVCYAWHGGGGNNFKETFSEQLMWVHAKELCVLGAGSLGTTEILLRSKERGLPMSSLIGQKISGNGDLLAFASNTDELVNGIGSETPSELGPCGPTITGIIDNRGSKTSPNIIDAYVIQEGAVPEALAPVMQTIIDTQGCSSFPSMTALMRKLLRRIQSVLFGSYALGSSTNRTESFLIMSHDNEEGSLALVKGKPLLRYAGPETTTRIQRLYDILQKATDAAGGIFIPSPTISVHPLGGAQMSSDGTGKHGVVNDLGQVLVGEGSEIHTGLVCLDGSIIPCSIGINPFATIAALAERSCDLLIQKNDWEVDETPNGRLDLFGLPAKPKHSTLAAPKQTETPILQESTEEIQFSELMQGNFYIGDDVADFYAAERAAKGCASSARLFLDTTVAKVQSQRGELTYTSSNVTGTFACGALSRYPLLITSGKIKFFVPDENTSDATKLVYDLLLLSTSGETFHFEGFKYIDSEIAFSPSKTWKATTTLFSTLSRSDGSLVGKGIIHISFTDFWHELQSLYPLPSDGSKGIQHLLHFIHFFSLNIFHYFLGPLRSLEYGRNTQAGYFNKQVPTSVPILSDDGVEIIMKTWESASDVPKRETPILLIPGVAVDDQIFSLPTIPVNTIDYFTSRGYRCYVPLMRFNVPALAQDGWTSYDTRWDVKAAMEYVRMKEDGKKLYLVCHCLGSISTAMALLTGIVSADWIEGMTISQVFCNLRFSADNGVKASTTLLSRLYRTLAGDWFSCNSAPTASLLQAFLDQILRFYPVGASREICASTSCHRCTLVFGRCWSHKNLNRATHTHLDKVFNGIDMRFLSHLMRMGADSTHHVRANESNFVDLVEQDENIQRLRGLRMLFVSGGENVVWDPASTNESYALMRDTFGDGSFERFVVDGYGHLDTWMGKESFKDVYPKVHEHIEMCGDNGARNDTVLTGGAGHQSGTSWFSWGQKREM
ncbi:hypothetical protein B0J11DRAFT_589799 [Dendryphion nanum]|uniref:FAD/NAD(P)-binding domain-containing protein n=1 Tax=Dendryphion nanum TaxID=256645 RepID=A0A9P9DKM8_9PLEO|nr:hypothetical protein B0J11DRAFT_589799 [Dendryphion nanum]